MDSLTTADLLILAIAAYLATMALVRLMRFRRDALVAELQEEARCEAELKRIEERRLRKEAEQERTNRRRSA